MGGKGVVVVERPARIAKRRWHSLLPLWLSTPSSGREMPDSRAGGSGGECEPRTIEPILVVDDDPSLLSLVREILEDEGYPVETAGDGAEALRVMEHRRPSVVLLDMRMPVMDGWAFAREISSRGVNIPILVMTAAQDARGWSEEIGAAGFVAKPFELSDLLDAVERLLGR